MKNQYKTKNLVKGSLLALAMILVTGASGLFAQQSLPNFRVITGTETWDTDQTVTSSIIIQNGATLTIDATDNDVTVGFEYVDTDGDGIGDLQIIVEDGGTFNSTGGNNIFLQASGTNPVLDADPTANNNIHWDGIVIRDSDGFNLTNATLSNAANPYQIEVAGTFTGLGVDGTLNGITVGFDGTVIAGATVQNIAGTGLIINANNVEVYSYDIQDVDTAMVINGDNAVIKYVNADTLSGAGFVVRGNNATLDWVEAKNGGIGLLVAGSGVAAKAGFSSGLAATGVTVTNSDFDANTTSMIVEAGGSVTVDNTFFRNATSNSVEIAGTAVIDNSSIISSGAIGVDVATGGSLTMTNSTDSGHVSFGMQLPDSSTVLVNRTNLAGNDRASNDIQLNTVANSGIQANMQNNWWGVGTRVDTMFTASNAGTVDYTDFRTTGRFLFNGADLNVTPSITFDNFADGEYRAAEEYVVRYSTTGNVRYLRFTPNGGAGTPIAATITTANIGTATLTMGADGADDNVNVTNGTTSTPTTAFSPASAIAVEPTTPAAAIAIITPNLDGTPLGTDDLENLEGGSTLRVRFTAPSTVSNVTITLFETGTPTNSVTLATSVDASLGYVDVVLPDEPLTNDGVVDDTDDTGTHTLRVVDAAGVATEGTVANLDIYPKISDAWAFTVTDNNMTVKFDDIDLFSQDDDSDDDLTDERLAPDNEVVYVGAFYTFTAADATNNRIPAGKAVGDLVNAGYTRVAFHDFSADIIDTDAAPIDISLTVYGDDPNTAIKDGFDANEELQYFVWRQVWSNDDDALTTYTVDINSRPLALADAAADDGDGAANTAADEIVDALPSSHQYVEDDIVGAAAAADGVTTGAFTAGANIAVAQLIYQTPDNTVVTGTYQNQVRTYTFNAGNTAGGDALAAGTADGQAGARPADAAWFYISSFIDFAETTTAGNEANTLDYDISDATTFSLLGAAETPGLEDVVLAAQLFDEDEDGTGETALDFTDGLQGGFWQDSDVTAAGGDGETIPIAAAEAFTMLKNGNGDVYWNIDPNTGGEFLGTEDIATGEFSPGASAVWDNLKGYLMYMQRPTTATMLYYLTFIGEKLNPEENPITLNSGWNLVPNLRGGYDVDNLDGTDLKFIQQLDIDLAMASIADPNIIVKDVYGDIYWPAFGINTIEEMVEMQSYFVYVSTDDVLTYPADTETTATLSASAKMGIKADKARFFNSRYKVDFNSDNSAITLVEKALLSDLSVGSEIGFFNSNGDLVGATVYDGGNVAATLWGQSSLKKEGEKGLKPGEAYTIKAFDPSTGEEKVLTNMSFAKGSATYSHNGINVIADAELTDELLPSDFALDQNYPNPFNPSTTINFSLPEASKVTVKVYNVMGQLVSTLVNREMNAGRHSVNFDASNLASGVYLYRIQAGSFTATRKMNLIK